MRDPLFLYPKLPPEKATHCGLKETLRLNQELQWEDRCFLRLRHKRPKRGWWLNPGLTMFRHMRRRSWSWEFMRRRELARLTLQRAQSTDNG